VPAWNAVLARKRVEVPVDEELLLHVNAVALDADSLGTEVAESAEGVVSVLSTGASGALRRTKGVQDALKVGVPWVDVCGVGDCKVDVLEGVVRIVFAVELVHDGVRVALARSASADGGDFPTINKGIAALPVLADLADALLRELLRPPLWALVTLKGLEGRAQNLALCNEVVAPELYVLEQPGHVDVETLRTDED